MTDEELLAAVQAVIDPFGCTATGIGPEAVNVIGDARAYRPSVYVSFPAGMGWEKISYISTLITNRVRVSRVLMELAAK